LAGSTGSADFVSFALVLQPFPWYVKGDVPFAPEVLADVLSFLYHPYIGPETRSVFLDEVPNPVQPSKHALIAVPLMLF
jgi:hypothetical protein